MPHFLFRNSRMMERGLDRARPDPARQTPGARTCLRTGGFDTTRFEEFGRCADATCERPGQDGDIRHPVPFTTARAHLGTAAGHGGFAVQAFGSDMRGQAGALPTIPGQQCRIAWLSHPGFCRGAFRKALPFGNGCPPVGWRHESGRSSQNDSGVLPYPRFRSRTLNAGPVTLGRCP